MTPASVIPDHTAVRVALWRALHLELDATPPVFEDALGVKLADPGPDWRARPDMHPLGTRGYRASIVGRARFIEDMLLESGVSQYVVLGAGLDTFAQRRPDLSSRLQVFEVDEPRTQRWKQEKLKELGLAVPPHLHFVPVNFELHQSWVSELQANGFDESRPALVASAGLSMYLTREANLDGLRKFMALAPGSTLVTTFMLPPELVPVTERPAYEMVLERTAAAGTPFRSLFSPTEMLSLAREAGLRHVQHVSQGALVERYFAGRPDGLLPASGEEFLVARV